MQNFENLRQLVMWLFIDINKSTLVQIQGKIREALILSLQIPV